MKKGKLERSERRKRISIEKEKQIENTTKMIEISLNIKRIIVNCLDSPVTECVVLN